MTAEVYARAWAAFGSWLHTCVASGRGAAVPSLGTFTLVKDVARGTPVTRPVFHMNEAFAQTYRCRPGTAAGGAPLAPALPLNTLQVALEHSEGLDKQQISDGLKHIIAEIGTQAAAGAKVRLFATC